jgi:hypothetical protein
MPRPLSRPMQIDFPPRLDADKLPQHGTAELCAQIHTHYLGPISPRVIRERWSSLGWRTVNGRSVTDIRAFIAEAQRRFDAAPVVLGGARRPPAEQQPAKAA